VANFYNAVVSNTGLSTVTQQVLWDLFRLFALSTMDTESREFFNSGAVSNESLDALPSKILDLMQRIRPHAVRLVDAWKIPDFQLNRCVQDLWLCGFCGASH
jgi:acyl-CoA oxidase